MNLNRPLATVTPTLDGDVLSALAGAEVNFTTGQLHRVLPAYSEEGIRRVLRRLVEQGVVLSERVGNAFAYRLNREHLAAAHVLGLAGLFRDFTDRLERLLGAWEVPPVYAAVFGSAVKGTMTTSSDIDLLIIRPDSASDEAWDRQLAEVIAQVARWTGNDLRPLQFTQTELRDLRTGEPVLRDVLDRGLTVAGRRAWLLRQLSKTEE